MLYIAGFKEVNILRPRSVTEQQLIVFIVVNFKRKKVSEIRVKSLGEDQRQQLCDELNVWSKRRIIRFDFRLDNHWLYFRIHHYRRERLSLHHNLSRSLPLPTLSVYIPHRKPISCRFCDGDCQLSKSLRTDLQLSWDTRHADSQHDSIFHRSCVDSRWCFNVDGNVLWTIRCDY